MTDEPTDQIDLTIDRLDDEAITALARGFITGELYGAWHPEQIEWSFGLMISAMASKASDEAFKTWATEVGLLYGPWRSAIGDRGINGNPLMGSMLYVHKDDMPALLARLDEMEKALGIEREAPPEEG